MLYAVYETLRNTNAHVERFASFGDGIAAAIFSRDPVAEETSYIRPGHHTLSYYLDGGYRAERCQVPGRFGAPDRLCTLPDEHESRWIVRDRLRLMHLYFLPHHLTRRAVIELDREPRELTLADKTYFQNDELSRLCASLASISWDGPDALLQANEIAHEALSTLLRSETTPRRSMRFKGGLAPATRRRVVEFIEAHLDQPLTVSMLADVACLSEYHLVRMFRISVGMPPHAWIASRRIDRARALLRSDSRPLQEIADACGYADLSHFSHRFRAATGVSPTLFRNSIMRRAMAKPRCFA